jgi:serine/threonine-protein kinase
MSQTPHKKGVEMRVSLQQRIDEVCLRFERAWKAGQRPALEDFLGSSPEAERGLLCRELIALEMAYRRRTGENPRREEYEARFPSVDLNQLPTLASAPGKEPSACLPHLGSQSSAPGVRFRILREHAKGGLGAVFLAHDEELHRDVALKEIQDTYAHHAESRSRFLFEAEVTGGLEHPGIVPVYGMGRYADGRPFYAMRFIKGESFCDAIRRFHAAEGAQRDLGERSLAFRELLGRFVAACNALAYAHARGVLHRDVKPQNIMLGKYGETLLVDWGLAKVVGHRDGLVGSEEGTLRPASPGDTPPTQMGVIMGTPAYMSPEQAEGRQQELGPASDIYSLGATLYELLTGREPIQGHCSEEFLIKAKRGEWQPPRKVRKEIPAALDQICRKAMALRPDDRSTTALELAVDIEHWLADEPVAAYREPWPGRLGHWVRRHRAWTAGAAGLLVTAVVALAVGIVLINQEKVRTAEAYDRLKDEQQLTQKALVAVEQEKQRVEREKGRAERALGAEANAKRKTRQALDDTTSQVLESWFSREKGKLEPDQEQFLKKLLSYYREFAQESGDSETVRSGVAQAHARIGIILGNLGQHEASKEANRHAINYYARLAADFSDVTAYSKELAGCHNNLGMQLAASGRFQDAEAAYRQALTIQERLAAKFPAEPGYRLYLAKHYQNLGNLLAETAQLQGANVAYGKAIALYEKLTAENPALADYRHGLAGGYHSKANLLEQMGRSQDADMAYRKSLDLQEQLAAAFPNVPDYKQRLAGIQNDFGGLLKRKGSFQEARDLFGAAIFIEKQLVAQFPAVPGYRVFLARHFMQLGSLLQETSRSGEAESAFREALAIWNDLSNAFPTVPA